MHPPLLVPRIWKLGVMTADALPNATVNSQGWGTPFAWAWDLATTTGTANLPLAIAMDGWGNTRRADRVWRLLLHWSQPEHYAWLATNMGMDTMGKPNADGHNGDGHNEAVCVGDMTHEKVYWNYLRILKCYCHAMYCDMLRNVVFATLTSLAVSEG